MFRQYMKPAMGRSNLKVITQAKTLKVEMEQQGGRPVARGVHFSTRNPANPAHQGLPSIQYFKQTGTAAKHPGHAPIARKVLIARA